MAPLTFIRRGAVACIGLAPLLVSGCAEDEPSSLVNCEAGAPEEWDSCYDYTHKGVHCTLEALRGYHADDRFELRELPDWALTEERNGAPIIYDVRAKELPISLGVAWGRLEAWAKKHDMPIDSEEMSSCAQRTTEAEMRGAEGGGRSTTEWGADDSEQ